MIFKVALGTTAGIGTLCLVSSTFRLKLDRNILRPIRDYRSFLSDYNRI